MIGTYPVSALAPLEYRYALDAAMPIIAGNSSIVVRCHIPELVGEVRQRIPNWSEGQSASACLWVEPMSDNRMNELKRITATSIIIEGALVLVWQALRPRVWWSG
jgi:hypothetical protein